MESTPHGVSFSWPVYIYTDQTLRVHSDIEIDVHGTGQEGDDSNSPRTQWGPCHEEAVQ